MGSNPAQVSNATDKLEVAKKVKVKAMVYDMSLFLGSCVDKYLELAMTTKDKLKKAATPFLDDLTTKRESDQNDLVWPLSLGKYENDEIGEKAERELSSAITAQGTGALASIACKILMKILYAARMCRYDLLRQ